MLNVSRDCTESANLSYSHFDCNLNVHSNVLRQMLAFSIDLIEIVEQKLDGFIIQVNQVIPLEQTASEASTLDFLEPEMISRLQAEKLKIYYSAIFNESE